MTVIVKSSLLLSIYYQNKNSFQIAENLKMLESGTVIVFCNLICYHVLLTSMSTHRNRDRGMRIDS
jgi:hypothetical protein